MPPKTRPARKLGSGPKTGPHRHPQNRANAWASPINEPTLPCWPLCGRILSGAPTPRGSANLTPRAPLPATPTYSRRFFPYPSNFPTNPTISCRFLPVHAQSTPRIVASSPLFPPASALPPLALYATTPGHNHATKKSGGRDEEAARGGTEGEAGEHVQRGLGERAVPARRRHRGSAATPRDLAPTGRGGR